MKNLLKNKKIILIISFIFLIVIGLIIFIKYNTSNGLYKDIEKVNKILFTNKNSVINYEKKLKTGTFKNTPKEFNNYILDIMDNMINVHSINDSSKDIVNIKNIDKVKEKDYKDEFNNYKKKLTENKKELKKIKNKKISINSKYQKLLNKINIDKCLTFIDKTNKDMANSLEVITFLNTNKDNWDISLGKIVFSKRKVFTSFEEVVSKDKTNIKYQLIDDKEAPVINGDNFSINLGEEVNLDEKVSCIDSVDDEVECIITGEYDSKKVGDYPIKIEAKDKAGNTSNKEIVVSVINKEKAISNKFPYYTEVIRNMNVVVVYGLDDNLEYTKIVKTFPCSVGLNGNTPTGTFTTSDKYVWRPLFGEVYGQYATRINGNILFHSVPYYSQDKGNLESEEFNKLGSDASMGCVRMAVSDVKWIFDNCPSGMTVKIYDGALPNGVSKPSAPKIDLNSPNKGWDPTDPDPNNPWR